MHTEDCHLCEQASSMLSYIGIDFASIDIATDPVLVERYGVRIPVVVSDDGRELGWPFELDELQGFVR